MESAGFQRVVAWDADRVDGRPLVPQPDVAALLPNHTVTETFEGANDSVR